MPKCAGQSAGDFEPELLPKTDRSGVCGNHEIELHGAKAQPARSVQAMLGHRTAYPLSTRTRRDHEACVRDVRPATGLVRPQNVGDSDPAVCFREVRMRPVREAE